MTKKKKIVEKIAIKEIDFSEKAKESKESVKSSKDKAKSAREKRIKLAKLRKKVVKTNPRDEFRKYFTKIKRRLNLSSELEEIIWLHFEAMGFDKIEKFDQGIKHFGYEIK